MQAERDQLVRFVFPRLREKLLPHRIQLVDVDLRWGVTSEQDASEVCREIIHECHPRFLCMLGGRYGWAPPGKARSITADEVHYGVLDRPSQDRGFAYFYFRDEAATAAMVESTPGEFREPQGSGGWARLAALKEAIADAGLHPFTYPARWDNHSRQLAGLKAFGDRVYNDLLGSMESDPELRDRFVRAAGAASDEFADETAAMEAFAAERGERFVLGSRAAVLEDLLVHARATGDNAYVTVTGPPGSGKSALLAHLSQHATLSEQPSTLVIRHFVVASPGSTDIRRTLRRLCHELKQGSSGIDHEIPEDAEQLRSAFVEFLQQACAQKRVVILLDAVNQFNTALHSAALHWLPQEPPPNARFILTTLDGAALEELRGGPNKPREVELKPLTVEDRAAILEQFSKRYRKRFEPEQRAALLAKTDAGVPLYLLTALEELRSLGTYKEITQRIAELPPVTRELFAWVFDRLETDEGFRDAAGERVGISLVPRFGALLASSRFGLSQRELVDLLDSGDPQGNVAALLRLLRPYLMRRDELLDFYHNQLREAAVAKYLGDETSRLQAHRTLAEFFRRRADPEGDSTWTGDYPRGLRELPHHQIEARALDQLRQTLCDLRFIEAKAGAGMAYELNDDLVGGVRALDTAASSVESLEFERAAARLARQRCQATLGQGPTAADSTASPDNPLPAAPETSWVTRQQSGSIDPGNDARSEPRRDRLRSFQRFVAAYTGAFVAFPGEITTLAHNQTVSEEAAVAAGPLVSNLRRPWLRRVNAGKRRGGPCARILRGHRDDLGAVAITPDGKVVASAGGFHNYEDVQAMDKRVRIWNAETGECVAVLTGHSAPVTYVALSANGDRCISANRYELICWNTRARSALKRVDFGARTLLGVGASLDLENVFLAREGPYEHREPSELTVWNLESGRARILFPLKECRGIWVAADASRVLVLHPDAIEVIRLPECVLESEWPVEDAAAVAATPSLSVILTGGADGSVTLWGSSGQRRARLEGHSGRITALAAAPDGKIALSASGDGSVGVWDLATERLCRKLRGHLEEVTAVAMTPDARVVVSGARDRDVRIWDLSVPSTAEEWPGGRVEALRIDEPRGTIVAGNSPGTLYAWTEPGPPREIPAGGTEPISGLALTPDGAYAVAAQNTFGRPGTIRVVELATGRIVRVLKGHEDGVTSVALSPDAKWLASGSWDKSVRIWDLSGGVCEHVFRGHNGRVAFIAWMADGRTLVCGGYHSIYVWELETGACRVEIGVQIYGAHRGTLTPDESALICAGGYAPFRGTARFALSSYDLSTGAETGVWRGHTGAVSGLAIDRTGSVIVSGSEDSTVRVWSLADQQELSVYPTLAPVSAISNLTTDGRVAIGLATGEVQLLRLENSEGRRQGGFHVHPDPERDAL